MTSMSIVTIYGEISAYSVLIAEFLSVRNPFLHPTNDIETH